MKHASRSSLHFPLGKLYKLLLLGKRTKKKITGSTNEWVQICQHVFGKSARYI